MFSFVADSLVQRLSISAPILSLKCSVIFCNVLNPLLPNQALFGQIYSCFLSIALVFGGLALLDFSENVPIVLNFDFQWMYPRGITGNPLSSFQVRSISFNLAPDVTRWQAEALVALQEVLYLVLSC